MSRLKSKLTSGKFYYLICLTLTIFSGTMRTASYTGFDETAAHDIILAVSALAAFLCFLFCYKGYSLKQKTAVGLLAAVGILCFLKTGITEFFMCLVCVGLASCMEADEVINLVFREKSFLFFCLVVLAGVSLIPETVSVVDKGSYEVIKYGSGFAHPNSLSKEIGVLLMLYIASRRRHLRLYHLAFVAAAGFVTYKFTGTRTSLLLITLAVILCLLAKSRPAASYFNSWFRLIYPLVFLIMFFNFWLYSYYGEDNYIVTVLNDKIFNGRIAFAELAVEIYGVSLFGTQVDVSYVQETLPYFNTLDNGQAFTLLNYGIAGVLILGFVYHVFMTKLMKRKETVLGIVASVMLAWSTFEFVFLDVGTNFTLLFFGCTFTNFETSHMTEDLKHYRKTLKNAVFDVSEEVLTQ